MDKLKLIMAVLILGSGIGAYYYLSGESGLVRLSSLLGAGVVAFLVAITSAQGRAALEFARSSRTELRKVVWPTGKETTQVTLVVIVLVILIALFLWLVDWSLSVLVEMLIK